jgi:hypothetical protein
MITIKPNRFRCLAVLLALMVAGCNSEWIRNQEGSKAANSVVPVNYKADIVALMHTYLNDPTGVRGAFVSEPTLQTIDNFDRYTVCLRYNARKSGGQYAGSKDSLVVFLYGRLDRIIDNARQRCKDAKYQPFPELERLTR